MTEEFGDEEIRIELKRMVRDVKSKILQKFADVEAEAALTEGVTEAELKPLQEKMERSREVLDGRFQQMTDFIDRR